MYRQAVSEDLNSSVLDSARRGYFGLLRRKRMSRQFVEREGEDLFALACLEYSRHLAEGKVIRDPVAWIIVCSWHRTVDVLRSRDWSPQMVSTEAIGELSAESRPAPDEEVLIEDRYRKVRDAVERLPTYQRQLLALSYFEGMSIREAARELGWTASKAQRAHKAAQRRLRKLLPVESMDDLETVGLVVFLIFEGERACSSKLQMIGGVEGAVDAVAHRSTQLGDRVLDLLRRPFDHGGASPGTRTSGRIAEVAELGHRVATGSVHVPASLLGRAGRRASEAGKRLMSSGAVETTAAAADGGSRLVEVCKGLAAACLIGGAATGALVVTEDHSPANRQPHHRSAAASARNHGQPPTAGRALDPRRATFGAALPSTQVQQPTSASSSHQEAATPSAGQQVGQPSPAARRAQRHQNEEATVEEHFSATQQIAAESEAPSSGPGSGALSSVESPPSSSTAGGGAASSPPPSAREKTEEAQTQQQFRGGLP